MSKLMTQVSLICKEDGATMTTWVDQNEKVKVGAVISLKGNDHTFTVREVYETRPMSEVSNRGFDNNNYDKHVGLGL